jgi:hypothetical protein
MPRGPQGQKASRRRDWRRHLLKSLALAFKPSPLAVSGSAPKLVKIIRGKLETVTQKPL